MTEDNEEIPDVHESGDKPMLKGRKREKQRGSKNKDESTKHPKELSAEVLEKQIPRKKKAMQIKIKHLLIELHGLNEIISKGKQIVDQLTRERERNLERIEEKEQVIEGKEHAIQSFHGKVQILSEQIEDKESELREKDHLLGEANEHSQLLQKQLAEQEKILKEMQSAIESLNSEREKERFDYESVASKELGKRVELESLRRENDQLRLQLREKTRRLRDRAMEIDSLKQEKDTLQQEKINCDKISLERKLSVDRLNREKERGLAYLDQLEIRLTEKQQDLKRAQDENDEFRDTLRRKENLLLEKGRTIETLEASRKGTSDRLDRLEKQLEDERRAQRNEYDALREEKRVCEESLRRAETTLETHQRRVRALEQEVERARQYKSIFRGDQPWMISKDEIKLSDKVLGTGAWGRVLEGNFRGTKVAVKEIHEIIQSAHNRLLFDREITFATSVRHPCILQFLAVADYHSTTPLLVAELMDMSLSQLVKDERSLGNRYIRILALDVAHGINYLHCFQPNPILHRDINSGNVMVWRQGDKWRGKLCDFGSAEFMGSKMSENPGNPFYSAPEASSSRQTPKVRFCSSSTPSPPPPPAPWLLIKRTVFIRSEKPLICRQQLEGLPDRSLHDTCLLSTIKDNRAIYTRKNKTRLK